MVPAPLVGVGIKKAHAKAQRRKSKMQRKEKSEADRTLLTYFFLLWVFALRLCVFA
jgi:hypothetical protein